MLSDKERDIFHSIKEGVNDKYYRGLKTDNKHWLKIYDNLQFEKRVGYWWIRLTEIEYMLHGEFEKKWIDEHIKKIVEIINDLDKESDLILKYLFKELNTGLGFQVEEFSEYITDKFRVLVNSIK